MNFFAAVSSTVLSISSCSTPHSSGNSANNISLSKVAEGLDEYLSAGFLFSEEQSLNEFKRKHGIPVTQKKKEGENARHFTKSFVKGDKEAGKVVGEAVKGILGKIFKGGI